jgi:hypothetical protein
MELKRNVERPHGMSARRYAGKLAANKRYRQRHPEKMRAYKKRARERAKAKREAERGVIEVDMEGCWGWTRGLNGQGYGMVRTEGRIKRRAHRVMWERYKGKISPGLVLHHKCQNRRCVNPDHLEMVTRTEHSALHRGNLIGRDGLLSHCCKGHEFTPENTYIPAGRSRVCRQCAKERVKKYEARQKIQKSLAEMVF